MALAILDGTQTATTLSTILSSGQHITAHTVVSLGTQAITDMRSAVSGSVVSISNFPATQSISGTVTANVPVSVDGYTAATGIRVIGTGTDGTLRIQGIDPNLAIPANLEEGGRIPVFGTVTANAGLGFDSAVYSGMLTFQDNEGGFNIASLPAISGTVTVGNTVTIAGTVTANPTGTQTIAGSVTIGAGTAQIGSVTASISNSVTIASFTTSVTARLINPAGTAVTYAEIGTAGNPSIDVLSVQGVTAGTPLTIYPMQGTTVSNTNFTSTTSSTTLVSAVAGRDCLTVFNEGAGNLHISPSATCTTISYQVRLSAGDYWECPQGQLSLAHTAVFATAGTARVTEVS